MKKSLFLVLGFLLAGCSLFVRNPVVTVKDLSVVSLDGGGAGMELNLTVKNPNPFDIRLHGYSYDLKVMSQPLAHGGAREETRFAAGSVTDLRIPIRVAYGDLLELFKRKPDLDRVPYTLAAGLDISTPVGQMSVPVNRTGTYFVPKMYRPSSMLNRLTDFFRMNSTRQ